MARRPGVPASRGYPGRREHVLPDVVEPGLRAIFCGTAASTVAARVGAPYAGPGNYFWRTLHEVGLTPRLLAPSEFRELPRWGLGVTDISKTGIGSDAEVGRASFDVPRLLALLEANEPEWIAFVGKNSARGALGRAVDYGPQPELLACSRVWVLPSTSGAARGFWDISQWRALAAELGA